MPPSRSTVKGSGSILTSIYAENKFHKLKIHRRSGARAIRSNLTYLFLHSDQLLRSIAVGSVQDCPLSTAILAVKQKIWRICQFYDQNYGKRSYASMVRGSVCLNLTLHKNLYMYACVSDPSCEDEVTPSSLSY